MDGMMNGSIMNGSMMATFCFMTIIGLLIFVVIIAVAVYVVARQLMRTSRLEDHPLMILKERYAKGEITEEEYRQIRRSLLEL